MVSSLSTSSMSSSSVVNLVNQPPSLLSNMSNMMTMKLENTNYIVWSIDSREISQRSFWNIHYNCESRLLSLEKEKTLLTFISSTLSPSILALTVGCATAMEVWKVLENRFSSISRSHIMNLKGELHNLKKGSDIVDFHLQKIKVVRGKLLAIGVIVDDEKLLHIAIKGLPKEYNAELEVLNSVLMNSQLY